MLRYTISRLAIFLLMGSLGLTAVSSAASAVRPVQGPVILARGGSSAMYIWDASSYAADLIKQRVVGDAAIENVEATAASVLADKARSSSAKTLTLMVFYKPLSAASIYGKPVFGAKHKLLSLSGAASALRANGGKYAEGLLQGKRFPDLHVSVFGKIAAGA